MNGILLVDKPSGMTSHDVVNRIRRIYKTKKVGHTGTLDPSATGVLVICINEATKVIQFMEQDSKVYEAKISIGSSTTTEDREGTITEKDDSEKHITREDLLAVLTSFLGKQTQVPPLISAIKVKGKKLYQYARDNEEVERPVREVEVLSIELLDEVDAFKGTELEFNVRIHVSKGTYIRTLAVDIGKRLGYPAHLKALRRTQSGVFGIEACHSLERLVEGGVEPLPMIEVFRDAYLVVAGADLQKRISHGQKLVNDYKQERVVFINEDEHVLAIYKTVDGDAGVLKPVRIINQER